MRTLLLTFSLCFSVLAQGVDYGYMLGDKNIILPQDALTLTAHNSNRNYADASVLTLGGQSVSGGGSVRENEIILKASTTYLWVIISGTAGNVINYRGEWYEH